MGDMDNMNKPNSIGERLRLARVSAGMSQREVAKKSGLTQTTIYSLESGMRHNVTTDTLEKLARVLEKPLPWLAWGWDGNPLPHISPNLQTVFHIAGVDLNKGEFGRWTKASILPILNLSEQGKEYPIDRWVELLDTIENRWKKMLEEIVRQDDEARAQSESKVKIA